MSAIKERMRSFEAANPSMARFSTAPCNCPYFLLLAEAENINILYKQVLTIMMKKYFFVVLAILILGCALKAQENSGIKRDESGLIIPNSDGSIPVQKDRQGLVSDAKIDPNSEAGKVTDKSTDWIPMNKKQHPEWYSCAKDSDCVTAQGECGSSCALNSLNSKYYSDYVVEFSKFCEGSGRTIKKCAYTKKSCSGGMCTLEFI